MLKKTLMTAAAALAITAGATTISTPDANAERVTRSFTISKSELASKCNSSGGTFDADNKGGYDCLVTRDDGSSSYVKCNIEEECIGGNNDGKPEKTRFQVPSRDLRGKQPTVQFSSPEQRKKTQKMKISRDSLMARRRAN